MDTPAAAATVAQSLPTPPRRPLQPLNSITQTTPAKLNPKPAAITPSKVDAGKENSLLATAPEAVPVMAQLELSPVTDVSLAEELGTARRRRERMRTERERTEAVLRQMDTALEGWLREMERRAEEQRAADRELRRLLGLVDPEGAYLMEMKPSSPVQSLRERERERRANEELAKQKKCECCNERLEENIEAVKTPQFHQELQKLDEQLEPKHEYASVKKPEYTEQAQEEPGEREGSDQNF